MAVLSQLSQLLTRFHGPTSNSHLTTGFISCQSYTIVSPVLGPLAVRIYDLAGNFGGLRFIYDEGSALFAYLIK